MHPSIHAARLRRAQRFPSVVAAAAGLLLAACGTAVSPSPAGTAAITATPGAATAAPAGATASAAAASTDTPAPETGGGTTSGDIPDNAVFLTFHSANPTFSIQYVEGWQVTPQAGGVVIRDKDSSETVATVAPPADVPGYVATTDLPALRALPGFKLVKQDTVKVGSATYVHLVYDVPAPPDPVTGKQVPSTVDRYYVPGPTALAVVSLSTPNGVDNVDAFRQMIQSFAWS
jgi:hypothetical protein